MTDQLSLAPEPEVSETRVRVLANTLAGFRWPERGSFERLRKPQQEAAIRAARQALVALAREED